MGCLLTENQIRIQDGEVVKLFKSLLLGILTNLNPGILRVLAVSQIVLDRAHSNKRLNSVLLRKFRSSHKEVVLACDKGSVIMGEIDNFVSALKCDIQSLAIGSGSFIHLDSLTVEFSLERVHMLMVRFEIK